LLFISHYSELFCLRSSTMRFFDIAILYLFAIAFGGLIGIVGVLVGAPLWSAMILTTLAMITMAFSFHPRPSEYFYE
jgi:hypothetical protein